MKFLHLSDLHIGLKLMNRDLREDQEYILKQVVEIAVREQPDAIVIAGDIYDKAVPSAEAVEVFDSFISDLTSSLPDTVIMMISGNHDSAPRVDCYRSVLSRQNLYMIGMPPQTEEDFIEKVTLKDVYGNVNFYLLPFVKPSMVKKVVGIDENGNNLSYDATVHKLIERENIDLNERNVLVSHQFYLPVGKSSDEIERMDSEIRTVGNIDEVCADVLEYFDYAALGHIHKPMKVGSEVYRYCGTPLACSVSEAGQQKGILMVELGEKKVVENKTEALNETEKASEEIESKEKTSEKKEAKGKTAEERLSEEKEEAIEKEQSGTSTVKVTVLPLEPLRQVRVVKGTLEEVLKQACEDYVTVILTDKVDLDVIDMQERIRIAFPNLLEIRRETLRKADYSRNLAAEEYLDPFELCCVFLKDLDDTEKEILRDVINTVQEVN